MKKKMIDERMLLKREKKQKLILENKNLALSILWLSLPIFLSNFMKSLNDLVDLYFITDLIHSKFVSNATAALNITNPIITITYAVAGGFMTAGAAIIAQYLGAKQKDSANKVGGQLLILCIITGIVMNIVLYFLTPSIVTAMGAEGLTRKYAIQYVQIRSFEMVPLFAFFAFQATRTSSGDTITPFLLNIIMIISNLVLTFVFMYFFKMGLRGAALGTILGNIIIMPIFMLMLFSKSDRHIHITKADIKIDPAEIRRIFNLSWPVSVAQSFTSLGFIILNSMILSYGDPVVNAFGTGNRINSLVLLPAMGIGSITATFVGQNIGAGNTKRAKESVKAAMILSILMAIIGAAIIMPIRRPLIYIFLKEQPIALEKSIEYMFFLLAGLPLMSIFQVYMGTYQGSGETKFSLILSIFRLWGLRIPLVLLFKNVFNLPESSLWYAMTISNFGSAYIGVILYSKCNFEPKVNINRDKKIDEKVPRTRKKEPCLT